MATTSKEGSRHENCLIPIGGGNWKEYHLKPLTRINWRVSLVLAAVVIPAPEVYIKVVAVKKLVVGFRNHHLVRRKVNY